MYKNQLQELAQRSCFSLPTYHVISEGPDHGPKYKAWVDFNNEKFESPGFYNTMREAEHAAAESALTSLSRKGTLQVLAARIVAGTGMCKNLLQETTQRAGIPLPIYITTRMGPDHLPVYSSSVEMAGMRFYGESAKTKKQAEKNAAMAAWSALRQSAGANADWTDRQEQSAIVEVFKEAAKKAREQYGEAESWLNRSVKTRRILVTDPLEAKGEMEKRPEMNRTLPPRRLGEIGNFPRTRRPLFFNKNQGEAENKVWRPFRTETNSLVMESTSESSQVPAVSKSAPLQTSPLDRRRTGKPDSGETPGKSQTNLVPKSVSDVQGVSVSGRSFPHFKISSSEKENPKAANANLLNDLESLSLDKNL